MKDCLFGTVNATSNTDISKYKYSGGYGFAFQRNKPFLHPSDGKYPLNLIIFGCDTSDSKNHMLVLGKDSVQINDTTIKAEKIIRPILLVMVVIIKKLYCHYTIMVMIVICLLIVYNKLNLKQQAVKSYQIQYV